ncbi:RNA polymerase sigma factor [bacterium SCSIO 12643]|nr:RNA polymerase sigma factor [bacterium SCSIO 12643]
MAVDQRLIQQCIKGKEKAYYELYKLCFSDLMAVCVRYFRNKEEAAPVLNKAFLRITQNLDKYKSDVPWDRWIKRIMINTIINEYKSQKRNKDFFVPTSFESGSLEFDNYSLNEIKERIDLEHIKSFIHELPATQKEVFNLYAIDGYTHKEIAEMLEIPLGTSKWLLAEARKRLKTMVTKSLNINTAIAI